MFRQYVYSIQTTYIYKLRAAVRVDDDTSSQGDIIPLSLYYLCFAYIYLLYLKHHLNSQS